jgi:hypothetical protein
MVCEILTALNEPGATQDRLSICPSCKYHIDQRSFSKETVRFEVYVLLLHMAPQPPCAEGSGIMRRRAVVFVSAMSRARPKPSRHLSPGIVAIASLHSIAAKRRCAGIQRPDVVFAEQRLTKIFD